MTSRANPPGYDPNALPGAMLRTGPGMDRPPSGNPAGMGDSCSQCPTDPPQTVCPYTPEPADGIHSTGCYTIPGDGSAPSSSGGGTGPGGSGVWLASKGAGLQRVPGGVGVSLPQVRSDGSCQGGGSCGGYVNLDGNLNFQVNGGSTNEAASVCPVVVSNSAATPATRWTDGSSPSVLPADPNANLSTPLGTEIVYTTKPAVGGYYATPDGVRNRLKLVSSGFEEHCFNDVVRTYDSSGQLQKWTSRSGTTTITRDPGVSKVIQDPAGRLTTYLYDAGTGKLASIMDSGGRQTDFVFTGDTLTQVTSPEMCVTEFTYDGSSQISSWTTPSGVRTTFTYDTGRVRTIQNPDGTRTFSYSGTNNDLTVQDAKGALSTYLRDSSGQLLAFVDPLNQRTSYTWNSKWPATIQDPRGNVVTYQYQALTADANIRQLQAVIMPEGGIYTYQLDTSDNLVAMINERGYRTTMSYSSGRLATIQDPLGRLTTYSYSSQYHQPSEIQDALGNRWTAVYDTLARKTAGVNPNGERTTFSYDAAGFVKTVQNPLNQVTTVQRDKVNRLTSVTNPLGEITTMSYATGCRLLDQTNPRGYKTTYQYDAKGRVAAVINPLGQRTSYVYDANGNQIAVTNGLGQSTTSTYDELNRLRSVTNALGYKTTYSYDVGSNLVKVQDALNQVTTNVYDKNKRLTAVANPLNQRTTYGYDAAGNRITVQNARGYVSTTVYNALSGVSEQIDELGNRTTLTYDAAGRQRTLKDGNSQVTTTTYDAVGRTVSVQDARGYVTTQSYDVAGRLRVTQNAEGFSTTYSHDAAGRQKSVQDPLGRITTYGYDAAGDAITIQNPRGFVTTSQYDALNRVVATQSPLGFRSTFTFDAAGRRTDVKNPLGYITTTVYDAVGQTLAVQDANAKRTTYSYNGLGLQRTVQDAEAKVTTYSYDAASRLIEVQDARGNRKTLTYDAIGQVTKEQDALNRLVTSTYDLAGRLSARQDARNVTTTYNYDGVGRVKERIYLNDGRTTITYDAVGNEQAVSETIGRWTYTYDKVNRVKTAQDPASKIITYAYDGAGQRSTLTAPTNGIFTYSYHTDGQTKTVQNPEGELTTFSYDNDGRLAQKNLANATLASLTYDAASQTTVVLNQTNSTTIISRYTYTYDAVGNRTQQQEGGSNTVNWSYYDTYRLKNETRSGTGAFSTTHTYDAVGNRTLQQKDGALTTFAYDAANQLTTSKDSTGTTTYSYDNAGNLGLAQAHPNTRTTYSWDNENRNKLLQVSSGALTTMTYRYDNLRYQKTTGATATKFIYDGQNYLAETDGSNTVSKVLTNEPMAYGNLISERLLFGGAVWIPMYYHFDALGSTRQTTSETASVGNTYGYDAWGVKIDALTSETLASTFRWVGQLGYYFDLENESYYVRARHYSPKLARWLSQDPLARTIQLVFESDYQYSYVASQPLRLVDTTGLIEFWGDGDGRGKYPPHRPYVWPDDWIEAHTKLMLVHIRDFANGKRLLLNHCKSRPRSGTSCTQAVCRQEVEKIMASLESAWLQLQGEGGPVHVSFPRLRWLGLPGGRACHECADLAQEAFERALPGGGKCFRSRRREVVNVPNRTGGTYDHCWMIISPSPSRDARKNVTVDLWNPGNTNPMDPVFGAGKDPFGYSPND